MREFKPSYYDEFKCIAGKCKHSCCVGWEIDVDEDKLEQYENTKGDFGEKLRENIDRSGECACFILKAGDRCPFLNEENLCEIIINMGEDSLCQICNDHPRFRNFFSDREEIGLGMCCEEVARIIVNWEDKVKLIGNDCPFDEEKVFFNMREQVLEILQDRDWSIGERIENLCEFYDLEMPKEDWAEVFKSLERLDGAWDEKLELLKKTERTFEKNWDLPFEQILVYFIYRHMAEGFYDGRIRERILFAILSYETIRKIFAQGEETKENLIEICRMYSSEIEYSEENIESVLRRL